MNQLDHAHAHAAIQAKANSSSQEAQNGAQPPELDQDDFFSDKPLAVCPMRTDGYEGPCEACQ